MKCIKKFDEMMKQLNKAELPIAKVEEVFGPYRNDTDGILVELISVENILTSWKSKFIRYIHKKGLPMPENDWKQECCRNHNENKGYPRCREEFVEVDKILKFGNNDEFFGDEQLKSISEKDIELGEIFLD